jgi:hypothetical protein
MVDDIQQSQYPDEQETLADRAPLADQEFRPLDARAIRLWRLTDLIGFGVLLVALLVSVTVTKFIRAGLWPWLMAGWLAFATFCVWYSFWRPPRYYRSWGYRIDDRVLETRSGLMFHRTRLLPLSRLQHVDIERGPFERMYGLSSLVLHTAGTHSASLRIPGLDAGEALRLRDHLIEIGGDDAV